MESDDATCESESVEDILKRSIVELADQNTEKYDLLLKKAREGFFEKHQTSGVLKQLAKQLLN
jgi:hypothetical protein